MNKHESSAPGEAEGRTIAQPAPSPSAAQSDADEKWLRAQILQEQVVYNDIWAVRRLERFLALPPQERAQAVAAEKLRRASIDDEAAEQHNAKLRRFGYRRALRSILALPSLAVFMKLLGPRPRSPALLWAGLLGVVLIGLGSWWLAGKLIPEEAPKRKPAEEQDR